MPNIRGCGCGEVPPAAAPMPARQWKSCCTEKINCFEGTDRYDRRDFETYNTRRNEQLTPLWQRPEINTPSGHLLLADRKSTRLNSSHVAISYAVFCLKK